MEIYKCRQCHSNLKLEAKDEYEKDGIKFIQKEYVCINQKCKEKNRIQRVTIDEK